MRSRRSAPKPASAGSISTFSSPIAANRSLPDMASTLDGTLAPDAWEVAGNPYLAGLYERVAEELAQDGLEVIGELPPDLDGVYLRNGPNPQFAPPGRYHWFDGDGMVHAVRFHEGSASYRNRWVRTRGFVDEGSAGAPLWSGVIEPRADNPRDDHLRLKDTANTDLVWFRDRVLSLWYLSGEAYELDDVSLESLGSG